MIPTVGYILIPDYSFNVFCPADPNAKNTLYKCKQDAEAAKGEAEKV